MPSKAALSMPDPPRQTAAHFVDTSKPNLRGLLGTVLELRAQSSLQRPRLQSPRRVQEAHDVWVGLLSLG